MPLRIQTDRLQLRPLETDDAVAFAAYRSDPEVARYQGWTAPYSVDAAMELIVGVQEAVASDPPPVGAWVQVAVLREGVLVGDCAFHRLADDEAVAEIGVTLSRPAQGQGYAAEALGALIAHLVGAVGVQRIVATCDVENLPCCRLLERLSFDRGAEERVMFKGAWGREVEWVRHCRTGH